ncbi:MULTISPECIES: MFS transporter [unclassified Vibrio]|uniref:MFS transporter n=1 Tax=unclassified Vibrio TaxID=2614977 RepID=UPI00159E095A|nr:MULTISPECIES: MFS transporter [unclassified Vibrio]NVN83622.1 MFS transporter [Vibrio sp. Scap16]QLE94235.1 MFS transporter [Vibrio sp. Scap24]
MNKDFVFFTANSLCVLIASRLTLFATSWWMVEDTGNASGLAQMMATALLVEVACRFLFANIGDAFNKKHVVMLTSLATGIASLAIFGLLGSDTNYMLIWPPIILLSVCNSIRMPVNASLLRFIVPESFLSRAISLNQAVNNFGTMVVPILSSGMISLLGVKMGLAISILSSVLSIAFLKFINYKLEPIEVRIQSFISMHRESWGDFLKIRLEVTFAVVCALLNGVMFTFFSVFVPYFASNMMEDGAWIMGALDGAFSIGLFVCASFIVGKTKYKVPPLKRAIMGFVGISITFSIVATIVLYHKQIDSIPLVVFLMAIPLALGGASLFLINNGISIVRAYASPKISLSSIIAFSASVSGLLIPVGLLFGGQIIDSLGMVTFCFVTAVIMTLSTIILIFSSHVSVVAKLEESEMADFYTRTYLKS